VLFTPLWAKSWIGREWKGLGDQNGNGGAVAYGIGGILAGSNIGGILRPLGAFGIPEDGDVKGAFGVDFGGIFGFSRLGVECLRMLLSSFFLVSST